ncbi:MAG: hypothetical protein AAF560_08825 [Acidobacteriota bacterium]
MNPKQSTIHRPSDLRSLLFMLAIVVIFSSACGQSRAPAENSMQLSRKLVLETSRHDIREIHYGNCHPSPGNEIVIAGYQGASLISRDYRELAHVEFDERLARLDVVDMSGDGTCEFLDRGMGWHSTGLLDHEGKLAWSLEDEMGIHDIAAGDLDDDGFLDLVVAETGGLRRHDHTGRLVWEIPTSLIHRVGIVDIDYDGRNEIVHDADSDHIHLRDKHGILREEIQFREVSTLDFSIIEPGPPFPPHLIIGAFSSERWLATFDGWVRGRLEVPDAVDDVWSTEVWSTMVRFQPGTPFAVALLFSKRDMGTPAILQLYDGDGDVVFRAEHDRSCWALAKVPGDRRREERLLVGCGTQLWEYSLDVDSRADGEQPAGEAGH